MRRTWWAFLLSVLLPLAAGAQETRGNISGTVHDSQAVIPGAAVKITNIDTKVRQKLVTNSSGYFEAPLLNPGNYGVRVELQGFKTAIQTGICAGRRPDRESDGDAGSRRRSPSRSPSWPSRRCSTRPPSPPARTSIGAWSRRCRCSRTCRSCCRASRRAWPRPRPRCRTSSRDTWKARRTPPAARSARGAASTAATRATTTRSTAPATTASAAASPVRPTPIRLRRCASRRRTSTPRRDTARGSPSR